MLFQRTDGLHQCTLEVIADTHNLTGSFHLCGQRTFCTDKLIKWQSGNLHNAVVQHRFKTCICLSGNRIGDFIQRIAQRNFCGNFCNRVTGCLTCQCGRTGNTGIYLDNTIFKAVRIQCILYITSAGNTQFCDNIQSRSTQHLVFFITQSLRRCHNDTVTGMYTYRVDIFHITYGNTVACGITHYLVLNFLPSGNAAFHKDLTYTGKAKAIFQNFNEFCLIVGNTAAASAQCIRRTKHNRISDGIGKCYTIFNCLNDQRSCHRLTDFFHGIFKCLTVLCLLNGKRSGSDQTHIVLFQKSSLFQFHSKIQSGLSTQRRQHTVRFFFQDQLFYHLNGQRLYINFIRNILVRHDGCRVGVQQYNFNPLFFQGTAGLCTCIVKFCGLTDDNRTRTNHQYFFNIRILWH